MISYIHAERTIDCPFSVAASYAAKRLRGFESSADDTIRVPLFALGIPVHRELQRRVHFSFGVHYDVPIPGEREHDEIRMQWSAGTRWLPDFRGTLRFDIASYHETRILLDGTYRPPFGFFGAIFDELLGRRIAAATMEDLLARVGRSLEDEERAFRAAHPPIL